MQSNPENEQLLEEELGSEFAKKGGKILVLKEDGSPQRWLCAINDNGEPFDPPGIASNNILHEINSEGKRVGNNPNKEKFEEAEFWRSDLHERDPKGKS